MGHAILAAQARNGRAAGNLVPDLEFLRTSGPDTDGYFSGSRNITYTYLVQHIRSVYRDSHGQEVRIGMDTYFKVRETKLLYKCVWRG